MTTSPAPGLAATIAGPATNGATMVYGNGEGQNTSHYYAGDQSKQVRSPSNKGHVKKKKCSIKKKSKKPHPIKEKEI